MATFDELVKQINNNLNNQRDRGTAFEKMVVAYLKNEPVYKQKFENVWMLNKVPAKYNISKKDTGVDIVAKGFDGDLTAVQAKFYKGKISKANIDSFVAATSKSQYADGILATTSDDWNRNARYELENTSKPFSIIGISQLRHAHFNWQKFSFAKENKDLSNKHRKQPFKYQKRAIRNAVQYYQKHDRGKLIMAPGTGKTFTSLKIAEALMREYKKHQFNILYLVPSIQLLSQTLFSWNNDVADDIHMTSFSIVSDTKANKKKKKNNDDLGAREIGYEPTTNVKELLAHYRQVKGEKFLYDMRVVFSTYQSIDVIKQAQKKGYPEFDLIVADEAHRTTGALAKGEYSMFTEVHSNTNIKGRLRLYQTATPKIYDQNTKKKAKENSVVVSSMDDKSIYGDEIFRLGFGEAVAYGYLTDYKVFVLAVSESYVNKEMQHVMSSDNQLQVDDIGKIIGVWNAMVKRNGITGEISGAPMKRAIAFTDKIEHSKLISNEFNQVVNDYLDSGDNNDNSDNNNFHVDVHHVDGGLNALQKETEIDWLGNNDIEDNHARILSNVRFLTEGIDVPNLDAIIFFSPKKSQVDIVQAVGRVMRLAKGKEYGYIILPIVVADDVDPNVALDNDKKYKQVWQVLNALRATDDRFDAEVNTLDLNKNKSDRINIIGVNSSPSDTNKKIDQSSLQLELPLKWKEMENAFYGKIVKKVGDRRYLEDWSEDVANIAKIYIRRINNLIDSNKKVKQAFEKFLKSLRYNLNKSINKDQAVEMLSQHLITEPVFDALFGEYDFVHNNAVSKTMNKVISTFKVFGFAQEQKDLEPFYDSVRLRASGIDNVQGKQAFIIQLYNSFFKKAFPRVTESMGIVFTPVEVVDFIIHSVNWALNKYFNKSLASENVHILDPFTGTGTFITRTLYYLKQQLNEGKITYGDILRNYMHELHANEIILLSYYIAAINIETVFDEINGSEPYKPFNGIALTDTFESTEHENTIDDDMFDTNNKRLKKQQKLPITAIISNPPYSGRQKSENDENANIKYSKLDSWIEKDYVNTSKAKASHAVYDSYIRAIEWASHRIGSRGIIGFITSNSYIDANSMDGLRSNLYKQFNRIFILNLKGSLRGKTKLNSKAEGQNIFNILTGVAIIIMIKDDSNDHILKYASIGNGLTRKEKLAKLSQKQGIFNFDMQTIIPNAENDWINQPFNDLISPYLYNEASVQDGLFYTKALGINSKRDKWVYNFSKTKLEKNIKRTISFYNTEVNNAEAKSNYVPTDDPTKISWSSELRKKYNNRKKLHFDSNKIVRVLYRPFTLKYLYLDNDLVARPGKWINYKHQSMILLPGKSNRRSFSVFVSKYIVDQNMMDAGCETFFTQKSKDGLVTTSNFNYSLCKKYGLNSSDFLAYVYALLNSKQYRNLYKNNLHKKLPQIPFLKNREKEKYVEIGKKLMNLHLNYEHIPVYDKVNIIKNGKTDYRVFKMKFGKKRNAEGKRVNDRSTIIYNDTLTIKNIPEKIYQYIINGKSAVEWIMDQYHIKTDNKSGITDDPNDYGNTKYIFNLLLKIINVSVQTVDLIDKLPPFKIKNNED